MNDERLALELEKMYAERKAERENKAPIPYFDTLVLTWILAFCGICGVLAGLFDLLKGDYFILIGGLLVLAVSQILGILRDIARKL